MTRRIKEWICFALILVGYALVGTIEAQAQSAVVFTWDNPTTRADGSALPASELIKTEIICSGEVVATATAPATTATGSLGAGSFDCAGITYASAYPDGTGESASAVSMPPIAIVVPVKLAAPNPPTGLAGSLEN